MIDSIERHTETRVSTMAETDEETEGEETDEYRRVRVDRVARALRRMKILGLHHTVVMWAELPKDLLGVVLEKLQEADGFKGSKHVRLVNREWRDSHDALVTRLTLSWWTTDEGMRLLVRRLPALVSLEVKKDDYYNSCFLTDKVLRAVSSLTGLTSLNLCFCQLLTDKGMLALSNLTGLASLNLSFCGLVTDEGMLAVSSLTGLTSLNLCFCQVTNEGLLAVSSLTGLTSLDLWSCELVTDEGLLAVSSLTGLTSLNLRWCYGVTREGVEALRRDTASSNLRIQWP
jgi:hypothetical protein